MLRNIRKNVSHMLLICEKSQSHKAFFLFLFLFCNVDLCPNTYNILKKSGKMSSSGKKYEYNLFSIFRKRMNKVQMILTLLCYKLVNLRFVGMSQLVQENIQLRLIFLVKLSNPIPKITGFMEIDLIATIYWSSMTSKYNRMTPKN